MMRSLSLIGLTLLLLVSVASPALARTTTIETSAPLEDQSEQSIRAALMEAVESAVREAVAQGYSWVRLTQAQVHEDEVTVRLLASDTRPEGETEQEEQEQEQEEEEGAYL
jgi:hypothetical protein